MLYPKNFNPHVNKYVFAKATGCKPSTAVGKIKEINEELETQGFNTIGGYAPISEIIKRYKTSRETLIYFWEQLGYGCIEKDTSSN